MLRRIRWAAIHADTAAHRYFIPATSDNVCYVKFDCQKTTCFSVVPDFVRFAPLLTETPENRSMGVFNDEVTTKATTGRPHSAALKTVIRLANSWQSAARSRASREAWERRI